MFKVKVIALGRCKEAWLVLALADYAERLRGRLQLDWALAEDMQELRDFCQKEPLFIALDIQGESLTSIAFSKRWMNCGVRTTFVIGGPDGLPKEVLERAQWRWSLSSLTFTNQIARILLVEQIYRALEIARGSPYHK